MKLAYITSQFPYGRVEAFLEAEVRSLWPLASELVVVPTIRKGILRRRLPIGVSLFALPLFGIETFVRAIRTALRQPRKVARLFMGIIASDYRPLSKLRNVAVFPKALAIAGMVRERGIQHIHAHWLTAPSTVAYLVSELTGVKWSCTAHQYDIFADNLVNVKATSAQFIRAISARNRDSLVSLSHMLPNRCKVVHLGVAIPPRASVRVAGPIRILCPAYFVRKKGHRYLLNALELLRSRGTQFACDLAGDGVLRHDIEQAIAAKGLEERVRIRGAIPHDRLMADLTGGLYDIVVLPSIEAPGDYEGIPVALMEAMAAGIPCVSTDTGSIEELIGRSQYSILVPQHDAIALADALQSLASNDRLRAVLGEAARSRVRGAFNTTQTTRELFELIEAV